VGEIASEKEETMKSGTLTFKVEADFVCDLARNLWAEGSPEKGINMLVEGFQGVDEPLALAICTGRRKLTGWSHKEIRLVKDNAKKDNRGLPLLNLRQLVKKGEREKAVGEKEREVLLREVSGKRNDRETLERWNNLQSMRRQVERLGTFPEVGPRPKPTPDKTLKAKTGWLSPDGKLYACQYYEHVSLADRMEDAGLSRGDIEDEGWLKLQRGDWTSWNIRKPVTQKQYDTLYDWCKKHNKKMPYWANTEGTSE
jgi:hypothetical protein